jgi:hypothetical protein
MDQRVKKLWVKALASGEFKQCRGYLSRDGKYCALGVLSILGLLEGVCTFNEVEGLGSFDNRKFTLSFNVMKWAGIAQENERYLDPEEHKVKVKFRKRHSSILNLNDEGMSFKEIAQIIRKNL